MATQKLNKVIVYVGDDVNRLCESLERVDKHVLNNFEQKLEFKKCESIAYSDDSIVGKKCDEFLFLISAHSGLCETFEDILKNIRYKRFCFFPVIFFTSEKLGKLQILSQNGFENKGFECAACGWGNLHLKIPFTLQELKEVIGFARRLDPEKIIRKGREGLLHCQTKVILE